MVSWRHRPSDRIDDREPVHPPLSDALGRHGRPGPCQQCGVPRLPPGGRVAFLLSGSPVLHQLLDSGTLVVSHQLEYLKPVTFSERPLTINLWVDAIGGSRFSIGYEVYDGDDLAARARTGIVPFDLVSNALRRLTAEERELLGHALAPAEPLRPLPKVGVLPK